ncbi:MAG: FAD-binding oxidoreductase [Legionellales bacterium]|nr:FAD-binding oxidoreductase [Legionellales bacterium]
MRIKQMGFLVISFSAIFFTQAFAESNTTSTHLCRCTPSENCWPSTQAWQQLQKQLTGKLIKPIALMDACNNDPAAQSCQDAIKLSKNPFVIQSNPGNTMSQGWLNAWNYHNSIYAVEAKNTQDIVSAVNFAREHHLRLAIKGSGHDYLGRSSAKDSLLIWTHNMRAVKYDPAFIPQSCPKTTVATPAVTVEAGARWLETYLMAAKHDRYVQGGGCTTVGAAGGFTQGGGFGSFSKKFGTGAAGVLQAEIVTADGKVIVANACQNKDLFWAIRGGGGSTFGVVTKMTLRTHPLPAYFGLLHGTITAKNDKAFKQLILKLIGFYDHHLNNPHWGEQITFNKNNTVVLGLVYQGENAQDAQHTWNIMQNWLKAHPQHYTQDVTLFSIPPTKLFNYDFWHANFPSFVVKNTAKGARPGEYWWASNSAELHQYWYTYQSWWLPLNLFAPTHAQQLADVVFQASRVAAVSFHINKGLAGASNDAIQRGLQTSVNPVVYHAATLVLMGAGSDKVYPDYKKLPQPPTQASSDVNKITQAMKLFKNLAPNSGTYANEADYFEKNWQMAFWGNNYDRLLKIKQEYDPQGLFYCHHCVGSENWSDDGMCRK